MTTTLDKQAHAMRELVRALHAVEQAREDLRQAMTPGKPFSRPARAAVAAADTLASIHEDWREIDSAALHESLTHINAQGEF